MGKGCAPLDRFILSGFYYITLHPKFFKKGLSQSREKDILVDGSSSVSSHVGFFGNRIYSSMGMERVLVHGDGA